MTAHTGDPNGGRARTPSETRASGGQSKPAKAKRAAMICAAIESDIVARGWPVGETLGSESELLEKYQVGRPVFREAVRLLESHQVASMRRGPGGGLVVTAPDPTAITDTVALYFAFREVSTEDILQTRTVLELTCVEMATKHLDEDGIIRLRALLNKEERQPATDMHEHSHHFHVAIAELSGSEAMQLFIKVLTVLSRERASLPPVVDEEAAQVHYAHRRIAEAMIAGDPGLARHRMLRHLEAAARYQP